MADIKDKLRCMGCKKIIAEGFMKVGELKIKCKCGTMNEIKATSPEVVQQFSGVLNRIV